MRVVSNIAGATVTEQMLLDRMAQMIRVGFVNARQPEKMRVKVTVRDTTNAPLVTDWLPVLCPRASGDMQYDLPDVGDQVLCLFLPYGLEQGFVVGAMYGKQVPPVQSGDKWHRKFADGTTLEYDRAAHKLTANVLGDFQLEATGKVEMKAGASMTLEAPIIYERGTLVNTARDGSPGKSVFSGGMEVSNGGINVSGGDVVAAGVSLVSHTTDGVEPGSGTSGTPTGGSAESPGTDTKPFPEPGTAAYAAAIALGLKDAAQAVATMPDSDRKEKLDELILCLPEIADAMAERKKKEGKEEDEQGWKYLAGFFRQWLATKVVLPENGEYDEKNYGPQPLFISWEWLDKYPRIAEKLEELKKNLITPKFIKDFSKRLKVDGYLSHETKEFNYIPANLSDTSQWKVWERDYQQRIDVPGGIRELVLHDADGLVASMGDFTLRAIPKGRVEYKDGVHTVIITEIAVYAQDGFNFEGNAPLLFWSCEDKLFSLIDFLSGTLLFNYDFRIFRKYTGHGGNFYIFSVLRLIDGIEGASYAIP